MMLRLAVALVAVALLVAGCGGNSSVSGEGYGFDVPSGWEGQADEESEPAELGVDSIVHGPEHEGLTTNVNVVREPGVSPRLTAADYVDLGLEQVRTNPEIFGLPPEIALEVIEGPSDGPRLDGAETRQVTYSLDDGTMLRQLRQTVAIRDGVAYTITYSALEQAFEPDIGGLDEILAGWRWSDG